MNAAPASRVTVVGESLVDLLWTPGAPGPVAAAGGSPANVALGLHRLERPVTLVTCWADDPPGALVRARLARAGLPVVRAPGDARRTALAHAFLDSGGSADYAFLAEWAPRELPVPEDTALVHTGSLAVVVRPGAQRVLELCEAQRARGRLIAADLNVRPAVCPERDAYRAACLRLAATADAVKASEEDLAWLYPGRRPEDAARHLLAAGPRLAVITLGGAGALAVTAAGRTQVAAPAVPVVDTVGAGDAFQAALLDGIAERGALPDADDLAALLARCTRAAALTCTRTGPEPPTRAELRSAPADPPAAAPQAGGARPGPPGRVA